MELAHQPPSALELASVNRLKIAVATAVIRCKPSQMTAKQFAQSLGQRLRKRQSDWKGRAESLEAELLVTRQKLAVARLRESGQFQAEQHSPEGWDSAGPDSWQDHQVEMSTDDRPELAYPTPPSSIPTDPPPQNTIEEHVRRHTQFLNCLASLKSLSNSEHAVGDAQTDTLLTVRDTALRGAESIASYVSSHLHCDGRLPWQLMKDALAAIARMLECWGVRRVRQDLVTGLTGCLETFLQLIVSNSHLNNHHIQCHLCSLVISLSSSQALTDVVLHSTLAHLRTVAAALRQSATGPSFDPTLYENGSYLLSVMEGALLSPGTAPSPQTGVDRVSGETLAAVAEGLENCSLHLADEFPLFCQRVWRLLSMLDWMRCSQTDLKVGSK